MSEVSRRRVLRGAAIAVAGTVFTDTAPAARAARRESEPGTAAQRPVNAADGPNEFDEVYRGRRIQGVSTHRSGQHHAGLGYAVLIDGKKLHVMQNADRTWVSVIHHYQSFPTPLDVARAAVDELQGAELVPLV